MSQEVCHQYWPDTAGKQHYGDLLVEKTLENKCDGYTERVLSITDKVGVSLYCCIYIHFMDHICSLQLAKLNIRWYSSRYRTGISRAGAPTHRPLSLWWRRCSRYSAGLTKNPLWSTAGQQLSTLLSI